MWSNLHEFLARFKMFSSTWSMCFSSTLGRVFLRRRYNELYKPPFASTTPRQTRDSFPWIRRISEMRLLSSLQFFTDAPDHGSNIPLGRVIDSKSISVTTCGHYAAFLESDDVMRFRKHPS